MADEGKSYNEHDDRVSFPQRRKKGRGPFRWKCGVGNRRSGRGGSGIRSSRFEEDDGDVAMNDPQDGPRVRFNPYTTRPNRRRDTWHDRDRIHVTVRRDRAPQERGGAGTSQDGTTKNWFKITIPYGKKYDKMWLLSMIQSKCSVPFNPIEFHYENTRAHFFVENATTASALKAVNYKIQDRENGRISIIINSSAPPYIVQNELKPEQVEQLKLIMSKRYDGSQQALDLKGLRSDPDLVAQNIDVVLNRRGCMAAALRIIEENIPELLSLNLSNNRLYKLDDMSSIVQKAPNLKILNLSGNELKSEWELDKIKGLKLEELWLDRNPMCDTFLDQSTYISTIRERFPKLLRLDGHELPPPIAFDVEAPTMLPPCKGSYFGTENLKSLVLHFLQQYYAIYDSGDRQGLLDAYHDGACCSLSTPSNPQNPVRHNLAKYFNDSRNVKKIKDTTTRFRLLKHTRLNVVAFLNELPKTHHDVNSFVVDISAQTSTLLCFSVNGVFKEVDGKSRDSLRAFTRTFIAVPASNSGLCIVNDELFVRNASPEEIQRAFAMPAPTPSSSPVPTLSQEQQDMLQAFSTQSGMNLEWSQKCLQDNNWDYTRSAQAFTHLKAKGEIPEVAFMK
uniref:Nuclear RNA export factor 1 n=1 Tax=Rattus norvegicus TaxID=10116 RepID=NXF1_RAT|nr:RecName: Full=Nuclear RNA export factor 1; AltName: Full=Tip-associated protein; AltName: Full=Tip-associating protein; AltName: Full=mRNA export factor TAP [Rattus norvegicus]AAC63367.1 tip associating protein [Rattus norvegicus]|eukprot:NP_067590.1 nuclear RNA export factor 1 [Rattus norvegicus]